MQAGGTVSVQVLNEITLCGRLRSHHSLQGAAPGAPPLRLAAQGFCCEVCSDTAELNVLVPAVI